MLHYCYSVVFSGISEVHSSSIQLGKASFLSPAKLMGKHNIHAKHPLQFIRLKAGLKQQAFADLLGISLSTLTKRESSRPGFKGLTPDLHRKLARELGAFVLVNVLKEPGEPGYFHGLPTGLGGVPYTREYAQAHMRGRIRLVKHSPDDVVEALTAVGRLCVMFKRETQFAKGLAVCIKGLCVAPQFKNAVIREIKKLITQKKFAAADWLCELVEDNDLRRQIPNLPGDLEHQFRLIQEAQKLGAPFVIANGNRIDLTKPLKMSDLLPVDSQPK